MHRSLPALALTGLILLMSACGSTPDAPPAPTFAPLPGGDVPAPTDPSPDTAARLEALGASPCPESRFICLTLTLPRDHFDAANTETIEVTFAVEPAAGERKGMFVTAVGGPGYAGVGAADYYTDLLDPGIRERFDIVHFDPRGVGESSAVNCPAAFPAYALTPVETDTAQGEALLLDAARAFVEGCLEETGLAAEELAAYRSRQAAEDLDQFRQLMGDGQIWLYGESYGTVFAQVYAAAHPQQVAALVLDSAFDTTLSGPGVYAVQAQGFENTLKLTLEACNADEECREDLGGDAVAFYDGLFSELSAAPVPFSMEGPAGSRQRLFTVRLLQHATASAMYSEWGRTRFLEALAEAYSGDLSRLAGTAYDYVRVNPDSLEPDPVPWFSDAIYFLTGCADFAYFEGTPEARGESYLRQGDRIDAALPHMNAIYYDNLPCAFWPFHPAEALPTLVDPPFPVMILGATADPATPLPMGEAVFRRLEDAYLVVVEGGPHIVFRTNDACVDAIVTDLLVSGLLPPDRETHCPGRIIDSYEP